MSSEKEIKAKTQSNNQTRNMSCESHKLLSCDLLEAKQFSSHDHHVALETVGILKQY